MNWWILLLVTFVTSVNANYRSPGETNPRFVEIRIGASADIYCSMNAQVFPGRNSSHLYFIDEYRNKVPPEHIAIINATTMVYMLRYAPRQQKSYLCKCGEDAIMDTKVYVGTVPQPLRDFACRSYDFEYMTCNFTRPDNPILTQYNLTFHLSEWPSYSYNPVCNYDENPPRVECNITLANAYKPREDRYRFTLRAQNALGKYTQHFNVNNLDVMVPSVPGDDFRVVHLTTDALQVAWRMPKFDNYRSGSLQWEMLLQPDQLKTLNFSSTEAVVRSRNEMHLRLNDLPYAFFWYELRLRVKVRPSAVWSGAFVYRFRTVARLPDRPPRTDVGSFYVDSTETQVRLYWEQLHPTEYNGDNFTYVISEMRMNDNIIQRAPLQIELNSAIFALRKNAHYHFKIRSRNHIGNSLESSSIDVYTLTHRNTESHTPRAIHNVYHATNRTYTLTWQAPVITEKLHDFTVFWCFSKPVLQNECNGSIHFKRVTSGTHKFITEPQSAQEEHTLNLAVSANYIDYNTGMHWTACTVDVNSDLVKMEPGIQRISETAIIVQWSSESVCTSILEGYNLTYCEIASNTTTTTTTTTEQSSACIGPTKPIVIILDKDAKKWEITKLKPYTFYKIEMFMFSKRRKGKISDPLLVLTDESAPTPPRQLQVSQVTNSSATITWYPPSQPNGKIRQYLVILNSKQFYVLPPTDRTDSMEKIVYELRNLTSYTAYKAYVSAQTVRSSEPSNDIHFTTYIGYPSMPVNVRSISDSINETVIQWSKPTEAAGRVEYYEAAVTQMRNDEVVRRRISTIIGTTVCTLRVPACIDHEYKTTFEVRAVNLALRTHEITMDFTDEPPSRYFDIDATNYEGHDELICLGGRAHTIDLEQQYHNNSIYRIFKSPWQQGPTYACSSNRLNEITEIALAVLLLSVGVVVAVYLARKKYNKMANINCILPPGLDTYITKDGFPSDFAMADQKKSNAVGQHVQQRSKEFVFHNEKHHLLASIGNDSGFLGDVRSTEAAEGIHIHAGYLRTQSESSADSLVESTDSNIELEGDTHQLHQIIEDETTPTPPPPQQRLEVPPMPLQMFTNNNNSSAYIKPATMSNWLQHETTHTPTPSSGYVSVDSVGSTPKSLANGYVQPAELQKIIAAPPIVVTPQTNLSGYTTLEELGKVGHTLPAATTDIRNEEEANTTISGYVTQRDLTAFGQQQQYN